MSKNVLKIALIVVFYKKSSCLFCIGYFPIQKITLIDSQGFMVIEQQIGNKTVIIKGKQGQKPC